jgi:hypothetical protein
MTLCPIVSRPLQVIEGDKDFVFVLFVLAIHMELPVEVDS